ncbi:MAG: HD-GYP domain-containing protein, partial [Dehalococcoidia bacterium]
VLRETKPLLTVYMNGVFALATVAVGLALRAEPLPALPRDALLILLLVLLSGLAQVLPLKLAAQRLLVLGVALQTVALLTLPPGQAAAVVGAGVLASHVYVYGGRRWSDGLFQAAEVALAVVAAGAVYRVLAPISLAQAGHGLRSLIALAPACLVLYAVSAISAEIATTIQRGRLPLTAWVDTHATNLAWHVLLVAAGAALATTIDRAPWVMLVLLASVAAIHAARRTEREFDEESVRIVEEIADAAESRHAYLAGSSRRVAEIAISLARARELPVADCRRIQLAARLHDVAMTLLPDFLELGGRGTFDEHQRFFWSTHCEAGADLVARVLKMPAVANAIELHHERLDGTGYPHGLRGSDIPLDARIVAVSEAWVALRSERGYRQALSQEQALGVLHAGGGTQWDAVLVETLSAIVRGTPQATVSVRPQPLPELVPVPIAVAVA